MFAKQKSKKEFSQIALINLLFTFFITIVLSGCLITDPETDTQTEQGSTRDTLDQPCDTQSFNNQDDCNTEELIHLDSFQTRDSININPIDSSVTQIPLDGISVLCSDGNGGMYEVYIKNVAEIQDACQQDDNGATTQSGDSILVNPIDSSVTQIPLNGISVLCSDGQGGMYEVFVKNDADIKKACQQDDNGTTTQPGDSLIIDPGVEVIDSTRVTPFNPWGPQTCIDSLGQPANGCI